MHQEDHSVCDSSPIHSIWYSAATDNLRGKKNFNDLAKENRKQTTAEIPVQDHEGSASPRRQHKFPSAVRNKFNSKAH